MDNDTPIIFPLSADICLFGGKKLKYALVQNGCLSCKNKLVDKHWLITLHLSRLESVKYGLGFKHLMANMDGVIC